MVEGEIFGKSAKFSGRAAKSLKPPTPDLETLALDMTDRFLHPGVTRVTKSFVAWHNNRW